MAPRERIYATYQSIRGLVRDRTSKVTRWTLMSIIVFGIPNLLGYATFWSNLPRWWRYMWGWLQSSPGKWAFIIAAFLVIWLDQGRITRKLHGRKRHDEKTLKGRTLKLRDDIKEFFEKTEPKVQGQFDGETQVGYIKRLDTSNARRVSRFVHGYDLYFAERVARTYHEYGLLGWNDTELNEVMLRPYKNEKCYDIVIAALARLAEQTMVMDAYPHLTWREISNMTTDEIKKIMEDPQQLRKFNALPPEHWF
jgi:hypothetical protein